MRATVACAALALTLAGCSGSQHENTACALPPREPVDAAVSEAPDAPDAAVANSDPPTPASPGCPAPARSASAMEGLPMGAPASMLVGNEQGLRELNMDGSVRRTLSTTPASRPRWGDARREVFFLVPDRAELRAISLETCVERVVAHLPREVGVGCGGWTAPHDPVASAQGDADFAVAPNDGVACLRVMDRNAHASTAEAVIQVSLADGSTMHALVRGEGCHEVEAPQPCARRLAAVSDTPAGLPALTTGAELPFLVRRGRIVHRGPDGRDVAAGRIAASDVNEAARSPSGRWLLLDANREEGDLIYRQLFLFDRRDGSVYPLRDGAWPAAMTAAQLSNRRVVRESAARVTAETPVRWLEGTDLLVVGTVLFNPGRGSVRLDGDLVI